MVSPVTDPKLLALLNASGPVTDPALLAQLNGTAPEAKAISGADKDFADPRKGMSWGEGALIGTGAAVDRAVRGVTGLLEGILPEEFARSNAQGAEDAKLYRANKPKGATVGEIGADVVMSAAPVSKLAKAVAALKKLGRAAPAVGDIAANAAWAGATAEPEERGLSTLLGAGGAAGARSVLKLARGATPGAGAQHLLDSGIPVTFGQVVGETGGAVGRGLRHGEAALEHLPFVGGSVLKNRETQKEAFQQVMQPEARMLPLALDYTPKEMIKASQRIGEPVPRLAQVAEDVIGSSPTAAHLRTSMGGGLALFGAGMYMPKLAIPAGIATKIYSLPVVQRFLTGQTSAQKAVEGLILQHPELAGLGREALTQTLRSFATQGAQNAP